MFADDLETFGDATALVAESGGRVSYRELAERADAFAAQLGPDRRLIQIEALPAVESIVAYVAALRRRHPVILRTEAPAHDDRLTAAFQPDATYVFDGEWKLRLAKPAGGLHPDLSVLLSTSGSTGSPKLVRLSAGAIDSNARSIVDYLGITPDDRAITSLPLGYSYGMSVLNSHLAAGAQILLTARPVTDPGFWAFFREHHATGLAGVPYTYELLERLGFRDDPPPSLKAMTQAGGRLKPELITAYAQWSRARGVRFFPMYGQTEAAPRMAYMPPDQAERFPDCIGRAIPGGEFHLLDEHGGAIEELERPGELVYRGPNVMMGYALARADLAKGPELTELRTGDLAVQTAEHFYKIVGRMSRFSKLGGKRIALDDIEALLAGRGVTAAVAGDDARLAVWLSGEGDTDEIETFVSQTCAIPQSLIVAIAGQEAPRLTSGKPDYRAMLAEAERRAAARAQAAGASASGPIAVAYATALGRMSVDDEESFVTLGGDSLAYVQASIEVERQIGYLPDGWENMSIAELNLMAAPADKPGRRWFEKVSTDVAIRAVAITAIVIGHLPQLEAAPPPVKGGALVLFMLAGNSIARFQKGLLFGGRPFEIVRNFALRVIVPYYFLMVAMTVLAKGSHFSVASLLLFSNLTGENRGPLMPYWFPEAMIQTLVVFCALWLIPPFRRLAERRPFATGVLLLGGAMALKAGMPFVWKAPLIAELPRSPDAWAYGMLAGWAAYFARANWQKAVVLLMVGLFAAWDWGPFGSRHIFITVALAALLFVPRIPLPRLLSDGLVYISIASFYTYLTHVLAIQIVFRTVHIKPWWISLIAALVSGVIAQRAWQFVAPRAVHTSQAFLKGRLRLGGRAPAAETPGPGFD